MTGHDSATTHLHLGADAQAERPVGRSILRGLLNRCPRCGQGRLFARFLKPVDECAACGEELHHQRADDLPPYIVVTIIGHLVLAGFLISEVILPPLSNWVHLAIWVPITVLGSLALLQPVKGGVVGLQWALRMHGFSGREDEPQDPLPPAAVDP